jgi:hypothetical protein
MALVIGLQQTLFAKYVEGVDQVLAGDKLDNFDVLWKAGCDVNVSNLKPVSESKPTLQKKIQVLTSWIELHVC